MKTSFATRALAALALLLALSGCGPAGQANGARPGADAANALILAPGDAARAAFSDLFSGVPVSGTLKPSVDVTIAAPISETLDEVLVKEGQAVARGQVLARFRTAALAPAAAGAEAQLKVATADRERMKNLLKEGAISERELEGAEAAYRAADAAWAAAKKRLDESAVRAPVGGRIAQRWVQSGSRVGDGDYLFRLVNSRELEFEATVPAEDAARVKVGAPALLQVSGTGDRREGRVARINPTADAATRQVKVYVMVDNRDGRLVGDLFASGRVVLDRAPRALAVPRAAMHADSSGAAYAWVVANGRAERRALTTGVVDEAADLIQVLAGLREGETVIVAGAQGLKTGDQVQLAGVAASSAADPDTASRTAAAQKPGR